MQAHFENQVGNVGDSGDLPPVGNCFDRRCPTRSVLAHVTGRWGSLVLAALRTAGVLRFSELRARIGGISEKMLAQTLRDLERDGLLLRTSRPVVPPYVDYRLTEMGSGVAEHLVGLVRWIEANIASLVTARRAHEAESANVPPGDVRGCGSGATASID